MNSKHQPSVSVVVPVYNSTSSLADLVRRLGEVFETLDESHEVILVDDGSQLAETWEICHSLASRRDEVTAIRLMKNFGKPCAVMCGLGHARGAYVATMDDDLQQAPEDLPVLLEHRDHDVVVAAFNQRHHGRIAALGSSLKGALDGILLGVPCRMTPLKVMRASVVRQVLEITTARPFIPAILARVTNDFLSVPVNHHPSRVKKSRYSIAGRIRQLSNLVISNSNLLLRLLGVGGAAFAAAGFVFALVVLVRNLLGQEILPGWSSLVIINLVFGGLVLVAVGIIGEYLIRILEAVSHAPAFSVREVVGRAGDEVESDSTEETSER